MQIRSPVSLTVATGQQSQPIPAPVGTEITVTIAAVNGLVQGACAIDYTVSADSRVSAGTADWVADALVFNAAGAFTTKVYSDCWVRVRGTAGTAAVVVNPAGSTITPDIDPFLPPANATVVQPPNDGTTGAIATIQAAHDALLAQGGGVLAITPNQAGLPYVWETTLFRDPRVHLSWPGKGACNFRVVDHFPLVSFTYRDVATGVVAFRALPLRCLVYVIPYAPFSPTGLVITPSSKGVIPYIEGFAVDGNKANQDDVVYGLYAPPGKTDPNWPFVAGAFSQNQVTNPGGAVNMNADAQAYYAFSVIGVDFDSLSGTGFFAGADRQRAHLGMEVRCTNGGVNNVDGTTKYLCRGFDIQGNDGFIAPGGGFGNNNGACQGSGQSGMMRTQGNFFIPKGTDSASITTRDESVNGTMSVNNVFDALTLMETAANNPIKARGGGYVGNNYLWTANSMQTSGPNTGRPIGVTTDAGDAFSQYAGYEQCLNVNAYSVAVDGTTPKYHTSAINGAGVLSWSPATTSPDGSQSYRGATPWFTDGTSGCIGGGWLDPFAQILHLAVSANGVLVGPDIAHTQFVQVDTPLSAPAGIVGQLGGTDAAAGYKGEAGSTSGSIALATGTAADVATLALTQGDYDVYGDVQIAATTATAAAANAYFEVSLSTAANTLVSTNARLYAGQAFPVPAGATNVPFVSLRVSLRASLAGNQTYHLVVKGTNLSTNAAIQASGVLHSRRW